MYRMLLVLLAALITTLSFGQQTETSLALNSGLFSFTGRSAESTSFINYNEPFKSGYTNNPYGDLGGLSLGLSVNLKRVTHYRFLFGLDLGYELLRSKIQITSVSNSAGTIGYNYTASGHTYLNYGFINIHPFIGYRVPVAAWDIDLTGGLELAECISTKELGKATTTNGTEYKTSLDRKTITSDIRSRVQLAIRKGRIGAYGGYSWGMANYKSGYVGGVNECYARMIRFGLTYRFK